MGCSCRIFVEHVFVEDWGGYGAVEFAFLDDLHAFVGVEVPGHDHCAGSCDGDVEGSDAPSMEEGAGDVDGLVGVPVEVVEDGAEGYWEGGFFALDSFGGPCCAGGVVDVG